MARVKEYVRLPGGRGVTLAGRRSLWRGADHLLYLSYRGFTEEYRRFYFADIQAIYYRKTAGGKVLNGFMGGIAVLFALVAFLGWKVQQWEMWGVVTVAVFAAIFVLFLVANLLMGPTCKCFLRTAVQLQYLPSIRRVRHARKAIQIIQPLIETVQGVLSPDQLAAAEPNTPGAFSLSSFQPGGEGR